MKGMIRAGNPVLIITALLGGILAATFIAAGIVLVFLGESKDTKFEIFGASFESQSVGFASIFLGAVTVVLIIRKVLSTLSDLGEAPSAPRDR